VACCFLRIERSVTFDVTVAQVRAICNRMPGSWAAVALASLATEVTLSFIYLAALVGVGIAIVFSLAEAVLSVSRPAEWKRNPQEAFVQLVKSEERRTQQLPFVGTERRQTAIQRAHDIGNRRAG
jgi:hypothetical protein